MRPQDIQRAATDDNLQSEFRHLVNLGHSVQQHVQLEMYKNKCYKNLTFLFSKALPCTELQRLIIKDENVVLIDNFSKNWSFDASLHKSICKSNITIFELCIAGTKLSNTAEEVLAKSGSKKKIMIYQKYQRFCEKAKSIIKDVRHF